MRPCGGFLKRQRGLFAMIMQMLFNGYRCHLHPVYCPDSYSHKFDRAGGEHGAQHGPVLRRILAEMTAVTTVKSTTRLEEQRGETHPYLPLHAHTFSRQTPALLSSNSRPVPGRDTRQYPQLRKLFLAEYAASLSV